MRNAFETLGHRILSPEQHEAELRAVAVADLREVAREAWDGGLLQVPTRGADWASFTLAPQYSASAVTGTRHESLEDENVTLVIRPEGVSLLLPRGPITVRYDACAAMTTRPDGARVLTGLDGFRMAVEPTLYRQVTAERIAVLDAAVPATAVVPLPPRDPERIPQPRERTPAAEQSAKPPTWGWTLGIWLIGAMATVWGLIAGMVLADELTDPHPEWDIVIAVLIPEAPLVLVTWALYKARRLRRR
ncbi:hypothetical protein ABZ468_18995 [Streptomyces sp. NPDC005708]|uniref:hypothetical protein n=1 Tax=Streptomyces sp. NPDC005708 TaxID=3154564 RepID=UPI0033E3E3C4